MWKHRKRQNELFSNMRFMVMPLTAVSVLSLIKLRWRRKRSIYLVHSNGWITNYTGWKIPVFYWNKDCLCCSLLWLKGNKQKRNIQSILCLLLGLLLVCVWVSVVSLALIWYCNFEILVCFIWSLHSSRGQLNTRKSWPFAPKWGGQRKGK